MTFNVITQASSNAPSLTGEVDSLDGVLQYALVDGDPGTVDPLGWTRPYSDAGSSTYIYRIGSATQSQFYLRVLDDNATTTRLRGYETATAYNSLTNPFPTFAQQDDVSGNWYGIRKSSTADATARNWAVIGNEHAFLLITQAWAGQTYYDFAYFGNFKSRKTSDGYDCVIICSDYLSATDTASRATRFGRMGFSYPFYVARDYAGTGMSLEGYWFPHWGTPTYLTNYNVGWPPNIVSSRMIYPLYIKEGDEVRGWVPGIWGNPHTDGSGYPTTTLSSVPGLTGATFDYYEYISGHLPVQTTDWDAFTLV